MWWRRRRQQQTATSFNPPGVSVFLLGAAHRQFQWVTEKWGKICFFKCLCHFSVRTRWHFWVSTRPKAILSPCYGVRPALNSSGTKIWGGNVSNRVTAALSQAFKRFVFSTLLSSFGFCLCFQIPPTEKSLSSDHFPECPLAPSWNLLN